MPADQDAPRPTPETRRVIVLGSTGSIGTQTLDVVERVNRAADASRSPVRFELVGLAAGRDAEGLAAQARATGVRELALADPPAAPPADLPPCRTGPDAAERLVREVPCDLVVAAIVGVAGLGPTLAAAELGRTIALANKESLVAAGDLVMAAARRAGARLHPVDSEHAAAWLAIRSAAGRAYAPPEPAPPQVERLTLTASGGPFRERGLAQLAGVTADQALKHPTWAMGAKVTIDSATLTNKALELIEARWLFGLAPEKIDAIIHPGSVVHALVTMADGAVLAQLAPPDMRIPVQLGMTAPHLVTDRLAEPPPPRLDLAAVGSLAFERPDPDRWPALAAAGRVMREGGSAGAVFNAANEQAVRAFLERRLPFDRITAVAAETMDALPPSPVATLADVLAADAEARRIADEAIAAAPAARA